MNRLSLHSAWKQPPLHVHHPQRRTCALAGRTNREQAPAELRNTLYNAAGLPQFYGINIMELNELGKSQRFNKIFATINTAVGNPVSNFAANDDEIMIGVDRSRDALIRPVVLDEGNTGDLSVLVDDQFSVRQNKIGYYGKVEEGRVCIDDRALVGLAVELS